LQKSAKSGDFKKGTSVRRLLRATDQTKTAPVLRTKAKKGHKKDKFENF
jgi:hypothetical protein